MYNPVISLSFSFCCSLDLWKLEVCRAGELWCMATEVILICSRMAVLLLSLATLIHCVTCTLFLYLFLFTDTSGVALEITISLCVIVHQPTILVQTEVYQQLLDGFPWDLVQTFRVTDGMVEHYYPTKTRSWAHFLTLAFSVQSLNSMGSLEVLPSTVQRHAS